MQQVSNIEKYFKEFLGYYIPGQIIELGTGDGQFIAIIRNLVKCDIRTFDVREANVMAEGIIYSDLDVFENENVIADMIRSKKTLLLCDDGDKIREVHTFAKYLDTGDVIMAHDYADNRESFIANKYWRTCELVLADVEKALKDFKPFHHDLMIQSGWMSYQKL